MNEAGKVVKHGKFGKDPRYLEEFIEGVDGKRHLASPTWNFANRPI